MKDRLVKSVSRIHVCLIYRIGCVLEDEATGPQVVQPRVIVLS